jgi:hypothetical protein
MPRTRGFRGTRRPLWACARTPLSAPLPPFLGQYQTLSSQALLVTRRRAPAAPTRNAANLRPSRPEARARAERGSSTALVFFDSRRRRRGLVNQDTAECARRRRSRRRSRAEHAVGSSRSCTRVWNATWWRARSRPRASAGRLAPSRGDASRGSASAGRHREDRRSSRATRCLVEALLRGALESRRRRTRRGCATSGRGLGGCSSS